MTTAIYFLTKFATKDIPFDFAADYLLGTGAKVDAVGASFTYPDGSTILVTPDRLFAKKG